MRPLVKLSAGLLLLLASAQTVMAMRTKSPTCDEFAHHLANGYSYLVTRDFRMNPASPPISRMLPAVPLLFFHAKLSLDHPSWENNDSPEFARQFFYHSNPGSTDKFFFWARMTIVAVSLLFGFSVFLFSRTLFGDAGGLSSLVLYSFSPNILAHSGLATADLMVAFFFFLSLVCFWHYLRCPSTRGIILTGITAGLTFLSKFSAVLLLPSLLFIALFSKKTRLVSPPRVLLFLGICLFTVWAGYFFEVKPVLQHTPDPPKKIEFLRKIGGPELVKLGEEAPLPLATFFSAIVSMGITRANGCDAFLMGEWSRTGWWYYYFVALLIKETIPFLILAFGGLIFVRRVGFNRLTAAVILVPLAVFFLATLRDKAQAGIRYFLPVFPSLFILGGAFAAYLWRQHKPAFRFVVLALLSWHAAEAAVIYPDYLAYFNEFIGGPGNGYKYLRDSNIDWAQDLKGVGVLTQKKKYPEVVLLYHGIEDPAYYRIPFRWPEPDEFVVPRKTVYALGAHHIDTMRWYDKIEPTTVVGHSIFIYDLRKKGS